MAYPLLTVTSVAKEYQVILRDDPYYYYHYTGFSPRATASLSYDAVTRELSDRLEDARVENAYYEHELARGELAFCPETMDCYECAQLDLPNEGPPILEDQWGHMYVERTVVALGPVVNQADPTQTYRLDCGHLAF